MIISPTSPTAGAEEEREGWMKGMRYSVAIYMASCRAPFLFHENPYVTPHGLSRFSKEATPMRITSEATMKSSFNEKHPLYLRMFESLRVGTKYYLLSCNYQIILLPPPLPL